MTVEFGTCPDGSWGTCPNAIQSNEDGWPTMRCKVSGRHPDLCHNYSKPTNVVGPRRVVGPVSPKVDA